MMMMQSNIKQNQQLRSKSSPTEKTPPPPAATTITILNNKNNTDNIKYFNKRTYHSNKQQTTYKPPPIPIVTSSNKTHKSTTMKPPLPKQQNNNNYNDDDLTSNSIATKKALNTREDDQYETATESSFKSSPTAVNIASKQQIQSQHKQQNRTTNHQAKAVTEERRASDNNPTEGINGSPTSQCELLRGERQRVSITSCSSSDSYVSYGSGYASGSGHSTDLEQKQRGAPPTSTSTTSTTTTTTTLAPGAVAATTAHTLVEPIDAVVSSSEEVILMPKKSESSESVCTDEKYEDVLVENEDKHDAELKKHLNELEHLTNDLAGRKISFADEELEVDDLRGGGEADFSPCEPYKLNDMSGNTTTDDTNTIISQNNHNTSVTKGTLTANKSTNNSSNIPEPVSYMSRRSIIHLKQQIAEQTKVQKPAHQYAKAIGGIAQAKQQQKSKSTTNYHNQVNDTSSVTSNTKQEPFYHNLFQWEQLVSKGVTRPLLINDLDFTDLRDEDDCDLLNNNATANNNNNNLAKGRNQSGTNEPLTINVEGAQQLAQEDASNKKTSIVPATAPPPMPPPPISPWFNTISGSRPQSQFMSSPSPSPFVYDQQQQQENVSGEFERDQSPSGSTYSNYSRNSVCLPHGKDNNIPALGPLQSSNHFNTLQPMTSLRTASSMSSLLFGGAGGGGKYANKRKKTMKLFWKEVREDRSLLAKLTKKKTIWDEIKPVHVDTQRLEHLFESKAKDLLALSKSRNGLDGSTQRKVKITVLDAKRSNAINIGMTKLPPMRTIKSAILKMDSSIMNREGIEKILTTMMPTEEEKSRIIEAQLANPDTPLGTAEQFLLNLASISALEARLKLWAFQLDYAQIEKEVAEPLMDLKQAIEEIERSETFRNILGTLLAIGNFLNSTSAKGFQIDYLEKVPEVKDTLHKHSLLHHLCLFIQEKYDPELEHDLYSEFSSVNRASKVDYAEVAKSLKKMQQDCKASWDYLKIVAKHDGLANLMNACTSSSSGGAGGGASSSSNGSSTNSSANSGGGVGGTANEEALRVSPIKTSGKLNNLSKLSMITTVVSSDVSSAIGSGNSTTTSDQQVAGGGGVGTKQLKTKVSDFLTDCAERIMVLVVIHRRVMNRFQKLLVYLGCPSHQIKQTQPQQILKVINEFALEYRTKRERVREMLAKKRTPCQHHMRMPLGGSRWQLNRTRWAGSQQCINSINGGGIHHQNSFRPCSTTSCASSCALGATNGSCADSICGMSIASGCETPTQQHAHIPYENRASSPSGFSQISNYSDYQQFDQQHSRQQSVTPVPQHHQHQQTNNSNNSSSSSMLERVNYVRSSGSHNNNNRRPNSMSVSMYDLQNQQQQSHDHHGNNMGSSHNNTNPNGASNAHNCSFNNNNGGDYCSEQRQKDEQLRRLLGAGKSLDESCNELFQMSHWSSTMTRVTRHPPANFHGQNSSKLKASSSMDESASDSYNGEECRADVTHQSSYYKYLQHHNGNQSIDGAKQQRQQQEEEENSDEEILQSLVRTATAKSSHHHHNHHYQQHNQQQAINGAGSRRGSSPYTRSTSAAPSEASNRATTRNKLLSRINYDRKSIRRTFRGGIEVSNVG